ncbi:MAG: hypothetical protein AM1032_000403 [Mycoplasmataceae bacterium]|nr:MAG: hypothetical protein AM1032_000403 [Mycoplasmataceae bacterium]
MKNINKSKKTRNWITLQILLLYIASLVITALFAVLLDNLGFLFELSPKSLFSFIFYLVSSFFSIKKLFLPLIEFKVMELNKSEISEENKIIDFTAFDIESKDQI